MTRKTSLEQRGMLPPRLQLFYQTLEWRLVEGKPPTINDLAEYLFVSKTAANEALSRLQDHGLIQRTRLSRGLTLTTLRPSDL
jgi:Mn-dependent DtxR family transcriptional regulator